MYAEVTPKKVSEMVMSLKNGTLFFDPLGELMSR